MPFPSVSVFGALLGGSWNLTLDTLVHLIFLAIFNGCGSSSSVSAVVSSHLPGGTLSPHLGQSCLHEAHEGPYSRERRCWNQAHSDAQDCIAPGAWPGLFCHRRSQGGTAGSLPHGLPLGPLGKCPGQRERCY